jgi:hypothetical protein
MLRSLILTMLVIAAPAAASAIESPLRLVENGKAIVAVEATLPAKLLEALTKLPADDEKLAEILSVRVGRTIDPDKPAIGGKYEIEKGRLRFTPRFAFKGGLTYRADLFVPAPSEIDAPAHYERVFDIPALPRGEPAKVTAVYPTAAVLPDNQLRFYLHFSAPMSRGEVYDHVRLVREDGTPVEGAFLEIGEELWDASGTRLTLLFDPGRVKRGLKPREIFGPVLEEGKKYKIVVDAKWHGADGQPLAAEYVKKFTAGPMNESAIDHQAWKVAPPKAGTRDPLMIQFAQPLDYAIVGRAIAVEATGKPVAGDVTIGKEERSWEFRPDHPWAAGKHELVIDTTLEDTAGNRIGRPFEVDRFDQVDRGVPAEFVRLSVEIGPAAK